VIAPDNVLMMAEDEEILWEQATRDVKPLKKNEKKQGKPEPKMTPAPKPTARSKDKTPAPAPVKKVFASPEPGRELDRRTAEKLRKGQMPIEARLDLHGLTQAKAHVALNEFILSASRAGRRCVLVITGKGAGVLQTRVPEWLEEPALRPLILRSLPAQRRHGGAGALYVYLRRDRTAKD
jgi:DNA-nicking Smr family endonuclease